MASVSPSLAPSPADIGPAPRLAVVNGLRGAAIAAVLYHHLLSQHLTPLLASPLSMVDGYALSHVSPFVNGWLGVNLFFVLSGFVLMLPYAVGERSMSTLGAATSFYSRRAARLLPLYYLSLLVMLLMNPVSDFASASFLRIVASMATFTFVFDPRLFIPLFNPALWSLGVEVWFSAIFPLLVILVRRFGPAAVTAVALVLALAVRLVDVAHWAGPPAYQLMTKDGLLGRIDDFVVGMAICQLHVARRVPSGWRATVCVLGGILLVVMSGAAWDNVVLGTLPFPASAWLNDVTLAGFGLLLLGLLGAPRRLQAPFTLWPLQLMGMMCYSLYLWHFVGAGRIMRQDWTLADVPMYVILVVLVSAITYRFVEFPRKSARELFLRLPA